MDGLVKLLLGALLVAVGLVSFAGLAVVVGVLWAAWMLRQGWARLTGRPVSPFIMGIDPRQGFELYRRARQQRGRNGGDSPGSDASPVSPVAPGRGSQLPVTDVEARDPGR